MRYISTRGSEPVLSSQAIVRGICPKGGLYVPESFVRDFDLSNMPQSYVELAACVMRPYLDIPDGELINIMRSAYSDSFDSADIAPVTKLCNSTHVLELFHGPTLAFKDMALQLLPYLMRQALSDLGENRGVYILVATSGDTGKAALEGFCDVDKTKVMVFYPHEGVSRAQYLQMASQRGDNVSVCGVKGNFDDAQTALKRIFADEKVKSGVRALGYNLSSANSINFGRLLPQIAYYFSSYAALAREGEISIGDEVDFCVPTGNFGNILAGYYAMKMGLPVHKLICASNRNNVLTDFFHSGNYNSRRTFYKSMSCSIDILVSSNLERLLFEAAQRKPETVSQWMRSLAQTGGYDAGADITETLSKHFYADWCDEEATLSTIKSCYDNHGYLLDPHTSVAKTVLDAYHKKFGRERPAILAATAHPFKFATDVLGAFEAPCEDEFKNADRLSRITGIKVPAAIDELRTKPIIHKSVCAIEDMPEQVLSAIRP